MKILRRELRAGKLLINITRFWEGGLVKNNRLTLD